MAQSLKQFKTAQKKVSKKRLTSLNYPKDLVIVAEGDSWFDYPFRKDVIDYLIQKGYGIDRYSKHGDTIENMIWGTGFKKKKDQVFHSGSVSLQDTLNSFKKNKPKIVLFSGGGNDVVGTEILGYLNHKLSKPDSLINKEFFRERLAEIKIAIEFFIQTVRKKSRTCNIIMDGYDYAKVNGKSYKLVGFKLAGPWILPSMGRKAITKRNDQKAIIKWLVDTFNEMLIDLDAKYSYFHHIDLRGEFPNEKQWDNEIHLKNAGFKTISERYHSKICEILNQDPIAFHKDSIIN